MTVKNVENTPYMSDKKALKAKVLIALSGGMHSMVAAYLLKIQKFDLLAVTLVNASEAELARSLKCRISKHKLNSIQEFCNNLGIPHQIINLEDTFKEEVISPWMAAKVTGVYANPCWNCHDFKMQILFQKMQEYDCQHIATGHFAKIFKNESLGTFYVHTGNDEEHDGSAHLSRLPSQILSKLILPLSDLQNKEVSKLAENFGVETKASEVETTGCLRNQAENVTYIEHNFSKRFLTSGVILNQNNDKLNDHQGVYHYQYSEPITEVQEGVESERLAKYSYREKNIVTAQSPFFIIKNFLLNDCVLSQETSRFLPFRAVAKCEGGEFIDCWVTLKLENHAYVELDSETFIPEGSMVTIERKKGKNSKIYLSGKVVYLAYLEGQEENNEKEKINYGLDF